MQASGFRIAALTILAALLIVKFMLPAPVQQITSEAMNANFAEALAKAGAENITQARRDDRRDQQRFQFTLNDCATPYVVVQASTLEDLQAVIAHAKALPPGVEPHVFYLGQELDLDDRLGLKWTAVSQFVALRLGLSQQRPSGELYVLLAAPGCESYRTIDWQHVWTA